MMINKKYQLIWFQHFHKAAGTSIVDLARANNETFWPNHENGNPKDNNGNFIELWKYSQDKLKQFIDQCEKQGVTFVATEWGLPDVTFIGKDDRIILITCLRQPLSRLVSNFYYDLYYGYTQAKKIEDYIATSGETFTMFNYYSRILSGHDNNSEDVTEALFLKAKKALNEFDLCLIMEHGFFNLKTELNWTITQRHSNRLDLNIKEALLLMKQGKMKDLFYRILYRKKKLDSEFLNYFNAGNFWDIQLYDEIEKRKKVILNQTATMYADF